MKYAHLRLIGASLLGWAAMLSPVLANCSDRPGSVEWYEPAMTRHFEQLRSQTTAPWGDVSILERINGRQLELTPAFNTLSGPVKQQVIASIQDLNFQDYLSAEEYEDKLSPPGNAGIGTWPYNVVTPDGRRVLEVYDGCTTFTLLTERDRFNLYFTRHFQASSDTSEGVLRNAGQPSWRQVNFPIDTEAEKAVRLDFWNSVGYDSQGWWIAWVPEQGHFEVNVPEGFDYDKLQRYWQVADRDYAYVVVRNDGSQLGVKRF
ncbi:MAG: phosphoribosylaminoimidazolesuccinocarboxamide synthase [Cyanobacteria bacterium J06560_6]